MSNGKPLPVLQGHWRLLEPEELIQEGDEYPDPDRSSADELEWFPVVQRIGEKVGWYIIRRRIPPTPKCETCYTCKHLYVDGEYIDGDLHQTACCALGVDFSATDAGWDNFSCSLHSALHPQAQEVTR